MQHISFIIYIFAPYFNNNLKMVILIFFSYFNSNIIENTCYFTQLSPIQIMPPHTLLPDFINENYEVHEWKHACAILAGDFPNEWRDIIDTLTGFRLRRSWISVGGGHKSQVANYFDETLINERGWQEKYFSTKVVVDETTYDAPTHKVDCYKNRVALEIEWNNKDPFYDRDLNNFRLLFDLRAISVGIIITRCDELQHIFNSLNRGSSYGASTTHMSKLLPRITGGSGAGCPLLVFGISKSLYVED